MEEQERQVLAEGRTLGDVVRERTTRDGTRWFSRDRGADPLDGGTVMGLVGISRDVTKRFLTDAR